MNPTPFRLLIATLSTALLVACGGGGGGGDPPVDQTPPTLAAQGATRAIVRKGDQAPRPVAFTVTVGGNPNTGTVAWKDEAGTARGTGNTLPLAAAVNAATNALAVGEHTLTATITNPANGRSAESSFSLLVLADNVDTDDDNDGLTYTQESTAGTDPANGDTDGDGLADGAEAGLGTMPTKADSDGNGVNDGVQLAGAGGAALPSRSTLAAEAGKSPGVVISADGMSVSFGSELNPDCVSKTGPEFSRPVYNSIVFGPLERCFKRAVRANVGITKGEFRYFETRRFGGFNDLDLQNIGQGILTPTAQIDPYCCYVDPSETTLFPYTDTPPSMTVNSIGGVFARLIQVDAPFASSLLSLAQTQYYGFAVDYRGADPVVYVVAKDSSGAMIVSNALNPGPFNNAPAMPMLHGHPVSGAGPHAAINLGLQNFHYPLANVRAALVSRGVAADAMAGGVGIHRW